MSDNKLFSDTYLKWVKECNISGLTNGQGNFAEWLLLPENVEVLTKMGDLQTVFCSIHDWLNYNK